MRGVETREKGDVEGGVEGPDNDVQRRDNEVVGVNSGRGGRGGGE